MAYARIEDGAVAEYPLFQGDIKLRFPSTSFSSSFVPPDGYVFIEETPQPVGDYTKNCEEGTPELQDSVWRQTWVVTDATPEEVQSRTNDQTANVRYDRNRRLADSDWSQLPDSPLDADTKAAWATYRGELRAVPEQAGFPWDITWPEAP